MMKRRTPLVNKIITWSYKLFPYLWLTGFVVAGLKTVFLASFLDVDKYLNPETYLIFTVIVGTVTIFYREKSSNSIYDYIFRISKYLLAINILLYLAFSYMEYTIWPNFVLSKFHIRLHYVLWTLVLLSVFVFIRLVKKVNANPFMKILYILLIFVFISNLFKITMTYVREVKFMIKNPIVSYDEKMKFKVGEFFVNYINFIKAHTEENSKIMIPPASSFPWPQTGNSQYIYFFLYPRTVFSGKEKEPTAKLIPGTVDYVLIAWGE